MPIAVKMTNGVNVIAPLMTTITVEAVTSADAATSDRMPNMSVANVTIAKATPKAAPITALVRR